MTELQQILQELNWIKTRLKYQNRLGLSGGRKYIAIEADKKSMWHYCDDDGTPVEATILTGYIKRIERREGDYPKLHIFVEADYEYVLVSGFSTHFSRQAMAAIASMSSQQLSLPVIIKPDTGNDDGKTKGKKPVFCNLIQDGRTIRSGQLGTRDAEELYQMAIAVLSGVSDSSYRGAQSPSQRFHVSVSPRSQSRDYVRSSKTDLSPKDIKQRPSPQQTQAAPVTEKPPGLDDELPPIPPMKAIAEGRSSTIATVSATQGGNEDQEAVKMQSVDWSAFCKQHGVSPSTLKALAQELGLPMGKLNPRQSALLYHQAYVRFVREAAS